MNKKSYIIGLDIGSTSIKARSLDLEKPFQAPSTCRQDLSQINPANTQRDPQEIWQKVLHCILQLRRLEASPPQAIGLCTFMHSLLLLDQDYRPLSPLILWNELESLPVAKHLETSPRGKDFYLSSGTPIHPMSPLCKIAYLRENDPKLFEKTTFWGDVKSWLLWKLSGHFILDWPTASATGLMDLDTCTWSRSALDYCNIQPSQLPQLVSPSELIPARASVFDFSCPVLPGLSDGGAANLGSGNIDQNQGLTLTLGTSGAVRFTSGQKHLDPEGVLFCYMLQEGHYVIGGASNNCGNVMDWFRQRFYAEDLPLPSRLDASGLNFLPWLYGERAPYKIYQSSASFWPLSKTHTLEDLYQALLLGILFNLRMIREKLESLHKNPFPYVRLSGGLCQVPGLAQLIAQVWELPCYQMQEHDASVLGILAFTAQSLGLENIPLTKLNPVSQIHEASLDSDYQLLFSSFKEISKVFSLLP